MRPPPSPSGGGGGTPQPGSTPQPVPTPAPIVKLAPHLHVGAPHWRSGRLEVAGSLASGARGHVLVTYTAKRHGKTLRVRAKANIRAGRYSARLRVPTEIRGVRASVRVSYYGDSRYNAQSATKHIR
jgi:hypothetical protein